MSQAQAGGGPRPGRWRLLLWSAIATVLLAPAIAMQFTTEVAWGPEDFALAALLLIGAGLLFELAARLTRKTAHRAIIAAVLLAAVLVIWADAAVGIF